MNSMSNLKEDSMKRECVDCEWCTMIETAHGNTVYICADEDGGNFMGETGLCGWCNVHDGNANRDVTEDESAMDMRKE